MTHQILKKKTTLAVFPAGKGFGYALMESPTTPVDYAMICIKPYKLNSYRKRISSLLDFFKPSVVIVEDNLQRKGKRVKAVINCIEEEAKKQNLPIYKYSRNDIKDLFKTFDAVTKYEIASFIASEIPELKSRLGTKRKIWESEAYFMPVFDAISLAMTYYYNN